MKDLLQIVLIVALVCFGALWSPKAMSAESKLNIVFIFCDDHAAQTISAYGSKINQTPHIDRLAKAGVLFENAFCANSLCGPSRATMLTGKHSYLNGFMKNGDRFDASQSTFPKQLQKAGYQTAVVGKWHLGADPTGFDYWELLPGHGEYYNPNLYEEGERKGERWEWGQIYEGYVTDIVTDLGLKWLERRNASQPFMLMIHHKAPHEPWDPPTKYLTKYDDVTLPEPSTLFDDYANRSAAVGANTSTIAKDLSARSLHYVDPEVNETPVALSRMTPQQAKAWNAAYGPKNQKMLAANLSPKEMARWRYQRYVKDYLRCIASVDDNVGRVLDYLEQNNLMENTVVVYTSDQGFYLGEHGWYDKRWMFEESLRMPLIMHWPGVTQPGTRVNNLVQNIDFAPTFCQIAGIEPPEGFQGRSLKAIFDTPHKPWRTGIYYHYYMYPNAFNIPPHEGIRTKRYKLINFYRNDGYNLFDLKHDPKELNDLSKDPDYGSILEQMKTDLAALRKQYDVPPLD